MNWPSSRMIPRRMDSTAKSSRSASWQILLGCTWRGISTFTAFGCGSCRQMAQDFSGLGFGGSNLSQRDIRFSELELDVFRYHAEWGALAAAWEVPRLESFPQFSSGRFRTLGSPICWPRASSSSNPTQPRPATQKEALKLERFLSFKAQGFPASRLGFRAGASGLGPATS